MKRIVPEKSWRDLNVSWQKLTLGSATTSPYCFELIASANAFAVLVTSTFCATFGETGLVFLSSWIIGCWASKPEFLDKGDWTTGAVFEGVGVWPPSCFLIAGELVPSFLLAWRSCERKFLCLIEVILGWWQYLDSSRKCWQSYRWNTDQSWFSSLVMKIMMAFLDLTMKIGDQLNQSNKDHDLYVIINFQSVEPQVGL